MQLFVQILKSDWSRKKQQQQQQLNILDAFHESFRITLQKSPICAVFSVQRNTGVSQQNVELNFLLSLSPKIKIMKWIHCSFRLLEEIRRIKPGHYLTEGSI